MFNKINIVAIFFILIISFTFYSCKNETSTKPKVEVKNTESNSDEEDGDSTLTPEEVFSSALIQDIIGEDENVDLQIYLEEQIYPTASKSAKVTLDRVSGSLYLLSYDENGVMNNYILQKFYNPVKDEFIFEKTEVQTNAVKQFLN
ncbi:MAG: hypothetical protein LH629_01945 [Ignavibacteria bacterium]|nr:hypothetical protein [Ignavibacteria bacterium]